MPLTGFTAGTVRRDRKAQPTHGYLTENRGLKNPGTRHLTTLRQRAKASNFRSPTWTPPKLSRVVGDQSQAQAGESGETWPWSFQTLGRSFSLRHDRRSRKATSYARQNSWSTEQRERFVFIPPSPPASTHRTKRLGIFCVEAPLMPATTLRAPIAAHRLTPTSCVTVLSVYNS